jgi:hypothetical protein
MQGFPLALFRPALLDEARIWLDLAGFGVGLEETWI